MIALVYRITLLEPALVTALEGDPNSSISLDYLPGSALRGAIIAAYQRRHPLRQSNLAIDPDTRRLFFSDTVRYLNGYLRYQKQRSLPIPLSWRQDKHSRMTPPPIYDFFQYTEPPQESQEDPKQKAQWQGAGNSFYISPGRSEVELIHPKRNLAIHTARSRRYGRATESDGAVFRYDALDAGQTFEAVVLYSGDDDEKRNKKDLTLLKDMILSITSIGGSRTGGYGRVRIELASDEPFNDWREAGATLQTIPDEPLTLTLLSDLLLRDEYGQFGASADRVCKALKHQFGTGVTLHLKHSFFGEQRTGGFNRKWGLPLPQVPALRRGSVFVFDATGITLEKLNKLETEGLGERRNEGFGRIAFLPVHSIHSDSSRNARLTVRDNNKTTSLPLVRLTSSANPEAFAMAQRMADRLLTQRLEERVQARAVLTIKHLPQNSQISRLREVLCNELRRSVPDAQCISKFLGSIQRTAREQYEDARIDVAGNRQQLLQWLENTAKQANAKGIETLLGFKGTDAPTIGAVRSSHLDAEGQLLPHVCAYWVLRYVDELLAHAVKVKERKA